MGIFDWFIKIKKILSEDIKKWDEEEKKNKTKDGLIKTYHSNGKLSHEINYKDGKRDGFYRRYSESGNLRNEGNLKDGKQNGLWKVYYTNGNLRNEGNLKDGERDGLWKWYRNDGTLLNEDIYPSNRVNTNQMKDIKGITHYMGLPFTGFGYSLYPNGKIEWEFIMKNGKKNGYSIWSYSNGLIKMEVCYVDDKKEGVLLQYFENGYLNLNIEVNYKDDKRDGVYRKYLESGTIQTEGSYRNDKKDGLWKEYGGGIDYDRELTYKNNNIQKRNDIGYKYKYGSLPLSFDGSIYKEGGEIRTDIGEDCYLDNEQLSIYDSIRGSELVTKHSHLVKGLDMGGLSISQYQDFYVWFKKTDEEKFKILFPDISIDENIEKGIPKEVIKKKDEIERYKNINEEFEYRNITFIDNIDDIIKILSSDKDYEFYFRFKEEFYPCLVQLEKLNSNDNLVSKWDDEFEDKFENEKDINSVWSDKDSFDNTNEIHKKRESIDSFDKPNLIYVDSVDLYKITDNDFRKLFLKQITDINKNTKLYDLNDLCEEVLEDITLDPGVWESMLLDGYNNEMVLDKQSLTQDSGYKVSWMRYSQLEGESFEFGYIEK